MRSNARATPLTHPSYQIFQYLGPRDLLSLARTSKNLRRFLFNRRTAGLLWETAVEEEGGVPEPLPFLSELAWINLIFSPHCHVSV